MPLAPPAQSLDLAVWHEENILFLHCRQLPSRLEFGRLRHAIDTEFDRRSVAAIVVTVPAEFRSIKSGSQRYALEDLVVDQGGQLSFVDYRGRLADAAAAEAAYRRNLLAELQRPASSAPVEDDAPLMSLVVGAR